MSVVWARIRMTLKSGAGSTLLGMKEGGLRLDATGREAYYRQSFRVLGQNAKSRGRLTFALWIVRGKKTRVFVTGNLANIGIISVD